MTLIRKLFAVVLAAAAIGSESIAQTPAQDPSTRLKEVLPAAVAQRVLDRIAAARARELPAQALENRALKFAAKGVAPEAIERSVNEQADRMERSRAALVNGRGSKPAPDEIEAGAEAMRKGVDAAEVSRLAKSAPNRSLAVPLFVIGTLRDRGLPSDEALTRVLARLEARASDTELEAMPGELPGQAARGQSQRPADNGRRVGQGSPGSGRPATAGPPAGVPGNAGKKSKPPRGNKPPK